MSNNVTLVTSLFDLAQIEGTTRKSSQKYLEYLEYGQFLFSLDQNIVFYAEPKFVEEINSQRLKNNLLNKTKIVTITIEQTTTFQYHPKVVDVLNNNPEWNRISKVYTSLYRIVQVQT